MYAQDQSRPRLHCSRLDQCHHVSTSYRSFETVVEEPPQRHQATLVHTPRFWDDADVPHLNVLQNGHSECESFYNRPTLRSLTSIKPVLRRHTSLVNVHHAPATTILQSTKSKPLTSTAQQGHLATNNAHQLRSIFEYEDEDPLHFNPPSYPAVYHTSTSTTHEPAPAVGMPLTHPQFQALQPVAYHSANPSSFICNRIAAPVAPPLTQAPYETICNYTANPSPPNHNDCYHPLPVHHLTNMAPTYQPNPHAMMEPPPPPSLPLYHKRNLPPSSTAPRLNQKLVQAYALNLNTPNSLPLRQGSNQDNIPSGSKMVKACSLLLKKNRHN